MAERRVRRRLAAVEPHLGSTTAGITRHSLLFGANKKRSLPRLGSTSTPLLLRRGTG
jgi:hypothetical protein